ncbi:MAG: type I-E CRISPR-associated protein Cse1/CasA, partial [Acidobacteria bacterium]|nr:type I-E CRISPR-associated protein Cse1/CasA [Acidobacteriota bacterium]
PDWSKQPEQIFAWLAPTPTSRPEDGHRPLGPDDMHALHAHWGMPRRVRLVAGPAAGRACAVTGEQIATAVVGVRMRNYGIDYASGYRHPHTPDYRTSEKSTRLPVLATARSARGDRLQGLIETSGDRLRGPASAMWHFPVRAGSPEAADPRMRCFGIDADKAKVVGWVDRTIALPLAGTLAGTNAVTTCLHPLCEALNTVTGMLRNALKRATRQPAPDTVAARLADAFEPALLAAWREAAESEEATPRAVDRRLDPGLGRAPDPTDPSRSIRAAAMRKLQFAALALFDELAPAAGVEHRDPFARAGARHGLVVELSGRTSRGRKVYADTLCLPVPGDGREPAPARMAPPPHRGDRSLPSIAWRWRNELEATSAGLTDRARLTHAHTLAQAREVDAAKALAGELAGYCDADTAAVIAVALALTREDGAFTAAHLDGQREMGREAALRRPTFHNLLQTPRNRLIEPLRRLLDTIPDRRADRRALAADIAAWGPTVRLRWTNDYLQCRTEPDLAVAYERGEEAEAR